MNTRTGAVTDSSRPSDFLPNGYITPNAYADRFMHLLTSDEWKVLSYTMRRIFGFPDKGIQDRISLTQYQTGTISKKTGAQLDHGTGLSRKTIVQALASLCRFKFIECVAPNDPRFDEGALYMLQLDSSKVDVAALEERAHAIRQANESRVAAARQKSLENRRQRSDGLSDSGVSHTPLSVDVAGVPDTPSPVYETHRPLCVGHTHSIQGENRGNTVPPPARQHATSSPQPAGAGEGGERRPLRLQDFRDHVEALSKTRAGAWVKDVEAVARSRWKRGKPEPEDVAEVRAFLAGNQPGSLETTAATSAAATPAQGGMSLAVAKTQVGSIMRAPNAGPPAAIVEQMFSSGQIGEEARGQLLEWAPTLTAAPAHDPAPAASGVPRQPHLHVVPAQAAS